MINAIPMQTLLTVDPSVARRAQRLQFAIDLLQRNHSKREVQKRVQMTFECSRCTAWRTVSTASDLV